MVKCVVRLSLGCAFAAVLISCSSTNSKPLLVNFSADSTLIEINNIDRAGLLQLKSLKQGDSSLNDLVSVLHTPSEHDSTIKEMPVVGVVLITDTNIVFRPDKPFLRGNDYFVVTCL